MKAILSYIFTAVIFASPVLLMVPAHATGCTYSGSGCTTPPTTYAYSGSDSTDVVKSVVITAAVICLAVSIYRGRFCLADEPMAEIYPYNPLTVAPEQPKPDNLYILEGR